MLKWIIKLSLLGAFVAFGQCPQPTHQEVIKVPSADLYQASNKAKLANLLVLSLEDEGKGLVNVKREDEIRRLCLKIAMGT